MTLFFCCLCSRVSCKAKGVANHLRLSATKPDWLQRSCLQSPKELFSLPYIRKNPLLLYYDFGDTGMAWDDRELGTWFSNPCWESVASISVTVWTERSVFLLFLQAGFRSSIIIMIFTLPPLLHLSCRRKSLNLGQYWKVCAAWPCVTSIGFSGRLVVRRKMARGGTLGERKAAAEAPAGDQEHLMKGSPEAR